VFIGQRVMINTGDHEYKSGDCLIREQPTTYRPIMIGDDVFIGMGAIILSGVKLGKGCVVAAGAVVTRDVAPYSVVAGVPARKLSERTKSGI